MSSVVKYMQSPDILGQEIDEDLVLVNLELGYYYRLNRTARDTWNAMSKPKSIIEVSNNLRSLYTSPPEDLESQISKLVEILIERGLIIAAID